MSFEFLITFENFKLMKYLSLSIPGTNGTPMRIDSGLPVPTGGLSTTGINAISVFVTLIVIVAIFFALWSVGKGGLQLIQSKGQKEEIQKGRERIFYALFGLIMIFLSFAFISAISAFFGVDLVPFLKFR